MDSFNQQALIGVYPFVVDVAKRPRNPPCGALFSNDWPTSMSQTAHDDAFMPYTFASVPVLHRAYGLESDWSGDRSDCLSAPSVSNYTDHSSLLNQFLSSTATTSLAQLYTPHYTSGCTGILPSVAGENPVSYRKTGDGLVGRHTSGSLTSASLRHTPYPLNRDSGALTFVCQWGIIPCGETVERTKKAIGHHLQAKHAIRLEPDMTSCLWEGCWKSMRRESIARHILAVHVQDKVPCTGCNSRFARLDSLQRHQRTCLTKVSGESTS